MYETTEHCFQVLRYKYLDIPSLEQAYARENFKRRNSLPQTLRILNVV